MKVSSTRRGAWRVAASAAALLCALQASACRNGGGSSDGVVVEDGQVAVTAITPTVGSTYGGTLVTIHGRGFTLGLNGPNEVRFGTAQGAEVQVIDDSTLTVRVPAGTPAAAVDVLVRNSAGTGRLDESFRYLVPAAVTSDLNDDGIADLVVSSPFERDPSGNSVGVVYVVHGQLDAAMLSDRDSAAAETRVFGASVLGRFGESVVSGDLNGDGADDLVVGAPLADTPGVDQGAVYVFHGPLAAGAIPASAANVTITGVAGRSGDTFGRSLAIGDVDGDGRADLVVGATGVDAGVGKANAGAAYVFLDGTTLTSTTAATAEIVVSGVDAEDALGNKVLAADISGDGIAELIVAAYLADPLLPYPKKRDGGAVYVFRGRPGLVGGTSAAADLALTGDEVEDEFGFALASGDVDGDGIADLVVGAPENDFMGSDVGRVYLFAGGADLVGGAAAQVATTVLSGQPANDNFGEALTIGDIDADGYDDVVIGAPRASYGAVRNGRSYVFRGGPQVADAVATQAPVIYNGETQPSDGFGGCTKVLDWNRDGLADVMTSAPGNDANGPSAGRVYVFRGDQFAAGRDALECDTIISGDAPGCLLGVAMANGQ